MAPTPSKTDAARHINAKNLRGKGVLRPATSSSNNCPPSGQTGLIYLTKLGFRDLTSKYGRTNKPPTP